eukprot:Stramenopile-MAST_4_protein_2096
MDSIRKREEELYKRNAELEARAGRAQENAKLALRMPKTFAELSAPSASTSSRTNDENMGRNSARKAAVHSPQRATNTASTPPLSPYSQPPPLSPQVQRAASRSAEKVRQQQQRAMDASSPGAVGALTPTEQSPPTEGLANEATFRYQRARIVVLQEDLARAKEEVKTMKKGKLVATGRAKELEDEKNKLERKFQNARTLLEKSKKEEKALTVRAEAAEKEAGSLRQEVTELVKENKKVTANQGGRDVRLNRALEENDRLKDKVKDLEERLKDSNDTSRGQQSNLAQECRRLERQRNELMAAFKKQMKLIDVLKRQKMHIEAAKLLNFTEEEFTRTLDITGTAGQ